MPRNSSNALLSLSWDAPHSRSTDRHVPPRVMQDVTEGLLSVPLAPVYMEHIKTCSVCQASYAAAYSRRFQVFDAIEREWRDTEPSRTAQVLRRAMENSNRLSIVSGEAPVSVWTQDNVARMREFLRGGGTAEVIAGPVLESDSSGHSPVVELASEEGFALYISCCRQDVHYGVSNVRDMYYVEKPHAPLAPSRSYTVDRENAWLASYFAMRFRTLLGSRAIARYTGDRSQVLLLPRAGINALEEHVEAKALQYDALSLDQLRAVWAEAASGLGSAQH